MIRQKPSIVIIIVIGHIIHCIRDYHRSVGVIKVAWVKYLMSFDLAGIQNLFNFEYLLHKVFRRHIYVCQLAYITSNLKVHEFT